MTGHTTGRLSAAHPWIYRPLRERLGLEATTLYANSQQQAVDHVEATAAELGIDCQLERRPSHVFTADEEQTEGLRAEADAVLIGLAEAITARGGRIHEHTRVSDIEDGHANRPLLRHDVDDR